MILEPSVLLKLLRYEPDTGKLYWRQRSEEMFSPNGSGGAKARAAMWNTRYAEHEAFYKDEEGYLQGRILNKSCDAHRVIIAIQTGKWPTDQVDHINGVRDDNRWCNLRVVSPTENRRNAKRRKDNLSGVPGVRWAKHGKWHVTIGAGGSRKHLGYFVEYNDAIEVRKRAETEFGYHENHGRSHEAAALSAIHGEK